MHVMVVLDKQLYLSLQCSYLSFKNTTDNISGSSSFVICEKLSESVKILHFFELPVQEKTCIKTIT